jgi:hypothetical protein
LGTNSKHRITASSLAWRPAFVQTFQLEPEQYRDIVVLNANAGVFLEVGKMGNGTLTLDDVLVELGLTAKWKAEDWDESLDIETIKSFARQTNPIKKYG